MHRAVKRLLHGERPDTSASGIEALRASATAASVRERAALDVEREVVDLYRTLLMRDRVGDEHEGNVTAFVGSGAYVTLDQPFVDVLVRYEAMGDDRYQLDSDELGVVGAKSGDRIALGDRIRVAIEDVAVLRRTVNARRLTVGGAAAAGGRRSAPKKRARAPVSHEKKPRGRTAPPGKRQTDRGRRQRG